MQQRADCLRLRRERTEQQTSSDGIRAERHRLKQCIDDLDTKQAEMVREEVSTLNRLDGIIADQNADEEDFFDAVQLFIEADSTDKGSIHLSPALKEKLRDARQIRHFVQSQEKQLRSLKDAYNEMQAEDWQHKAWAGKQAEGAAARGRHLEVRIKQLTRAVPARRQYLESTLQALYAMARVALLEQGYIEPEDPHDRLTIKPVLAVDDTPGDPPAPPNPDAVQRYERLRNKLEQCRKDHDQFGDAYAEYWDQYFENKSQGTKSEFGRMWFESRWIETRNLRTAEKAFVMTRDEVLRAGAQPLRLSPLFAHRNVPIFAHDHPEDGKVSTEGPEEAESRGRQHLKVVPDIERWLGIGTGANFGDADDAAEQAAGSAISKLASTIAPWDSASQQERHTEWRKRIEEVRQLYASE